MLSHAQGIRIIATAFLAAVLAAQTVDPEAVRRQAPRAMGGSGKEISGNRRADARGHRRAREFRCYLYAPAKMEAGARRTACRREAGSADSGNPSGHRPGLLSPGRISPGHRAFRIRVARSAGLRASPSSAGPV